MNTNALKQFAPAARTRLMDVVGVKLDYVLSADTAELRGKAKQLRELQKQVDASSRHDVVERVAYTWFNRFMALRFMDANGYTDIKVVSPVEGHTLPEILAEAKRGNIEDELKVDRTRINELLDGRLSSTDPQTEVYKLLLVAVCNQYYGIMPFMFEPIDHYTELLMPDDLLGEGGILHGFLKNMSDADCADVEIVGWLYQFYMSEKKGAVMARKKAVPKEDIAAVTQLFTPHWIVRYLVENSLGRLWMLNHPDSKLVDRMDYYINPEEPEKDFLKISSPEEIKICDPACGSGHMLTYAFDLLYAIYEEQGYNASEISEKILANNLHGIEIDERAGELAGFALFMKGRQKYRRFFRKPVQPNVCVLASIRFEDGELKSYMDEVGRDLFTAPLQNTLLQFEEADNFGSLIIPEAEDVAGIQQLLEEKDMGGNLLLHGTHVKVLLALQMTDYLSPIYHVVLANPPYMGSANYNASLKQLSKSDYKAAKKNLFAMFMVRNRQLAQSCGFVAMITLQDWMFISSFRAFRETLFNHVTVLSMLHLGARAFDSISGEIVQTAAFVMAVRQDRRHKGNYVDLTAGKNEASKQELFKTGSSGVCVSAEEILSVTGAPVAYWVSDTVRELFSSFPSLSSIAAIRAGMATGDNQRFVRAWTEVEYRHLAVNATSRDILWSREGVKWVPFNKGGEYRKWFGDNEAVLCYDRISYELLKNSGNHCPSEEFYFKPNLTWSDVTSAAFGVRFTPAGSVFSSVGNSIFAPDRDLPTIACFLCSAPANALLKILNPTLHVNPGEVGALPFDVSDVNQSRLVDIYDACVECARRDWDAYETSWGFESLPLLDESGTELPLREACQQRFRIYEQNTEALQLMEIDNNRIFIDAYGLQHELTPDVPLNEVTLTCNPHYRYGNGKSKAELEILQLADTMKEFISYGVGCMFGRYSLDKPGLILANQGETLQDYLKQVPKPTFTPDEDNALPVLDDDYFVDDVVGRFKTFLRTTFGESHYDENLAFIEKALGKSVRKYFLNDFYAHHLQMYKKRPIYWLFSSPKKSFNVLIYMHRYRPDTVSRILNEYLREFVEKLKARRANQEEISISESARASDKSKATKEMARIDKSLAELDDYERNILYPLAAKKVEIDLDDGVTVNYNKFGDALRPVPGLSEE